MGCHETVDRHRHGRQEHRRVEVFEVSRRLPPEWRGPVACAARIARLTWRKDTRTGLWRARREVAYYVSQIRLDAASFGRAVRAHWGIENRAHHVRDRILREDDSRIRRKPGIFARPRSTRRCDGSRGSASMRRAVRALKPARAAATRWL